MKNKKSYIVENKDVKFRRARIDDDFEKIAELIYKTDQYIYPFWFKNVKACKKALAPLIKEEGFIFNYNNIYVAYYTKTKEIVGIVIALDKTTNLKYDYKKLENVNEAYKITIEHYIKDVLKEVKEYKNKKTLCIPNVCVQTEMRGKKIGTRLLGYYIKQMEHAGYEEFHLDCLLHNLRAKNLYHSMGFKEIYEMAGFDGTLDSTVEVVHFTRKKGNYIDFPYEVTVNVQ